MEASQVLWTGSQDGYRWLVSLKHSLSDLLGLCPELILNKYLAVTAFDSGELVLTEEEKASGWRSELGVAYSPLVTNTENLPYDNCYDEWYVLAQPKNIGQLAEQGTNIFEPPPSDDTIFEFVNYHLGLHHEPQKDIALLFWTQLTRVMPETYLADTQSFVTLVSRDARLFDKVLSFLQANHE